MLSLSTAGLLLLSLTGAVGLVELSTYQHQAARDLERAFKSARLSGELRVELLRFRDGASEAERKALGSEIQRRVELLAGYTASPEGRDLEQANHAISRYLHPSTYGGGESTEGDLRDALQALKHLIGRSESQANAALARTARWDRVSDRIGLGIGAALVLGVAALLSWLWLSAFKPLFAVSFAMRRFAAGDRDARAVEGGPKELRRMAGAFNEMAVAIAEQQDRQLAFVAGVAHDLRNPIAAMRLGAASLRRKKISPSAEELSQRISLMDRQTERLERLVGDFLDQARIESGQLELKRAVCDVREVARASVELFEGVSAVHPVRAGFGSEMLLADCDHGRIEQVLNNLLSNAIKYTPDGGTIEVTTRSENERVVVEVRDRGIGISVADQTQLFRPYRRVGGHRESIAGVGLGLFISRRIVQAHGGDIAVRSAEGEGATFLVWLPLAQPRRRDVAERSEPRPVSEPVG